MARMRRTARSIGLVIGLTIVVLVATGVLLTLPHYSSANKQQRLVVSNYETISLMRQALIVLQDTEIGQRAYIAIGATVLERRRVGEGALVSAGALVTRDVEPHVQVMGVPAQVAGRGVTGYAAARR